MDANWKLLGITSSEVECVIDEYETEQIARREAETHMRKQERAAPPEPLRFYIQRPDGTRYRVVLVAGNSRRQQEKAFNRG